MVDIVIASFSLLPISPSREQSKESKRMYMVPILTTPESVVY